MYITNTHTHTHTHTLTCYVYVTHISNIPTGHCHFPDVLGGLGCHGEIQRAQHSEGLACPQTSVLDSQPPDGQRAQVEQCFVVFVSVCLLVCCLFVHILAYCNYFY